MIMKFTEKRKVYKIAILIIFHTVIYKLNEEIVHLV